MPKVSIVVPAYNVTATLSQTIASLRAQTYDDFEIVIVNDGSTDATPALADTLAQKPGVRVVHQKNRGLAGARNSGIAAARGDYIGFCDADDLWMPTKLATHVAHLEANPSVGLSYSGSRLIASDGSATRHRQRPRLTDVTAAHILKRNPIGNGSAPVLRRSALAAIAWRPLHETERDWVFDETFRQSEDIECWLRLALSTDWDIEGVPGDLTLYRVNPGGLSANTAQQLQSWERMIHKLTPLDPAFFATHTPAARAYQLRYLARRAISDLDGPTARRMMHLSNATSLRPYLEEPVKTLTTLAASLLLTSLGTRTVRKRLGLTDHNPTQV